MRVRRTAYGVRSKKRGLIFVISGPSGSGKTTLAAALVNDKGLAPRLAKSISATTRPKRTGEREGRDYFFLDRKEFLRRLSRKKILEWTKYLGYYYGTPAEFVENKLARGKSVVFCLDFKGVCQLKKLYPTDVRTIFVIPPSLTELKQRIVKRSPGVGRKEIEGRLRLAGGELSLAESYDYRVINTKFSQALKDLKKIIKIELGAAKSGLSRSSLCGKQFKNTRPRRIRGGIVR